ncbi:MAG TPA: heme exporter protein CcmD [Devosiaceae bacterium]|jgi:heme exporter protein CcmD|nr:heme exporter protein CcmD [Devosiaceae bacterium]
MDHTPFILATYLGVALLLAAMIAHAVWDSRRVARRLQALEERGIRRRSAATVADDRP